MLSIKKIKPNQNKTDGGKKGATQGPPRMCGLSTYSSEARGSGRSGRSGGSGKSRLSGDAISARGARRSLKRERAGQDELRPGATPTSSPQHPRAQRLPLGLGGRCLLWVPLGLGEKKQKKPD